MPPKAHADKPLTLSQCIAMGERGAKLVFSVSNALAECEYRLIDMASKTDARKRFMEDRAVAIVHQTLLHLDDQFKELGFGAWMPFRWPDQWLSFTGVMTRVLAANGLIYAKHADVYRKLLDETPMVDFEGSVMDRVKESRTPNNIARCKANQGAYTMSELKTRLQREVWGPADESERCYEEYWRQQMSRPPG